MDNRVGTGLCGRKGKAAPSSYSAEKLFSATALLAFFQFGAQWAMASTFYVSETAGIEGDASVNAPFKTIGKATTVVNPGDTVGKRR